LAQDKAAKGERSAGATPGEPLDGVVASDEPVDGVGPLGQSARARFETLERLASLGQVSAGLTHEVRNVMTGVLGFAQVARTRLVDRPETVPGLLVQIEHEIGRCLDILNHFLGFTRPDAARSEPVALGAIVDAVVRLVRHQLAMSKVRLEVRAAEGLPLVEGNAEALKQVLLNLVQNAVQAMPDGGTVRITTRAAANRVVLEVNDTGAGVPLPLRHKIFEPFFTTKALGEGSGLGLYICRSIVASHRGELEFVAPSESARSGARFRVSLPRIHEPEHPRPHAEPVPVPKRRQGGS
jgi:signal transduction histidine kinase